LGDSEVFAVKHTPAHTIPELGQCLNNDLEVSPAVRRTEAWYVLDEKNSGATFSDEPSELMKEPRLLAFKPWARSHPRKRDILAGESSDPDIGKRDICIGDLPHVLRSWDIRPVLLKYLVAERVDLTLKRYLESGALETQIETADA
jgi:hypothetical protein